MLCRQVLCEQEVPPPFTAGPSLILMLPRMLLLQSFYNYTMTAAVNQERKLFQQVPWTANRSFQFFECVALVDLTTPTTPLI